MKEKIIDWLVNYTIKNGNYSKKDEEIIRYGIANLYLQITKTFVITLIAILLKIFIPYLIFTFFYNILRLPSFGIHAKKSYQCWISSLILFIGLPYLSTVLNLNIYIKIILAIISTIYITIYSPADTYKRPIVSKKRSRIYKILSCIISIIYSIMCLLITNKVISNALLLSLLLQCGIISPITYKIFNQPYNNYKEYIRREEQQCSQES